MGRLARHHGSAVPRMFRPFVAVAATPQPQPAAAQQPVVQPMAQRPSLLQRLDTLAEPVSFARVDWGSLAAEAANCMRPPLVRRLAEAVHLKAEEEATTNAEGVTAAAPMAARIKFVEEPTRAKRQAKWNYLKNNLVDGLNTGANDEPDAMGDFGGITKNNASPEAASEYDTNEEQTVVAAESDADGAADEASSIQQQPLSPEEEQEEGQKSRFMVTTLFEDKEEQGSTSPEPKDKLFICAEILRASQVEAEAAAAGVAASSRDVVDYGVVEATRLEHITVANRFRRSDVQFPMSGLHA